MTTIAWADLLDDLSRIAVEAGRAILAVRAEGPSARLKPDGSPVCDADMRAQAIICERLHRLAPKIPVLAEEDGADLPAPGGACFLVDPLDGTKDFLAGSPEFAVSIAVVQNEVPMAGVLLAPALGRLFTGAALAHEIAVDVAHGLPLRPESRLITTRRCESGGVALESCSHRDGRAEALALALEPQERRPVGSSIKFGLIAAGEADWCVRAAGLAPWDVAAGDAILRAAGGAVLDFAGRPLTYGATDRGARMPPFLAAGDLAAAGPRLASLAALSL